MEGKAEDADDELTNAPVVIIVGSTAVGKTKLSLELARAFDGEVVNSDAIQVYTSLPIGSAAVTAEEAAGVRHHLLAFLDPLVEAYDVSRFRPDALAALRDCRQRGKLGIVVGGSMYYSQSLIWASTVQQQVAGSSAAEAEECKQGGEHLLRLAGMSADELREELLVVDELMAKRIHRNDRRRLRRALEVFYTTGRKQSELIVAEQAAPDVRAKPTLQPALIWLRADADVLDARVDARVDSMMAAGLRAEVSRLWLRVCAACRTPGAPCSCVGGGAAHVETALDAGLFNAIGFKEFLPFLRAAVRSEEDVLAEPADGSAEHKLLAECVAALKRNTRRFTRAQVKWVRQRMLYRGLPVLQLDTSDVTRWQAAVLQPAEALVRALLAGQTASADALAVPAAQWHAASDAALDERRSRKRKLEAWVARDCEVCGRSLRGEQEWSAHVRSRGHRRRLKRARRAGTRGRGGKASD